jgi:hypothetical protein
MSVLTATVGQLVFDLVEEGGRYRWTWPDGSPTAITANSVRDAQRTFAFRGMGLEREWLDHLAQSRLSAIA